MNCKNKVSVIIPIFNAEKCIDRCMKSIYAQTFTDYEIILVNDGSTDRSADICRGYAESDDRIVLIDKENGGAGSARNAGIEVATGEYVYFCDADDQISRDLLSKAYSAAEKHSADLTVFSINRKTLNSKTGEIISEKSIPQKNEVFKDKESFRSSFSKLYYEGVLFGGPVNKLFKSDIIKNNNILFPDLKRGQDEIFNLLYYRYVSSCVIIPDVLYTYFSYDQRSKNRKYRLNYFETTTKTYLSTFEALISEFGISDTYTKEKYQNSFVYSMENSVLLAFNPVERLSKKQKVHFIQKVMNDEYVLSKTKEITCVPDSHTEFWQIFSAGDTYKMYKFLRRRMLVEKIKNAVKNL